MWNYLFENVNFGQTIFLYLSRRSSEHHYSFFSISDFLEESFKANKNSFYKPQLTWHWKQYATTTQAKTFLTLQIFQQTSLSLSGVRKKICTAPILDAQELHSWSNFKAIVWIFLFISLLFQRRSKALSGGGGMGGNWIISLRRLAVWAFQIILQLIILIEIFKNSFIF